jgi:hypothetical protein
MAEEAGKSSVHRAVMSYFPMFIATLSLATSLFNGYLNNKFVDIIQHNVERVENLKTCKEIIDAYFQVKFRVGVLNDRSRRDNSGAGDGGNERIEASNAVNRFAALGTYLANLRDQATRERYTHLTQELERIVAQAARAAPAEFGTLFEVADQQFTHMNDDCVKAAKNIGM